jgi:phytoene dehydrogenase-like protein
VEIRTAARVESIRTGPGGVEGVRLADGETVDASVVAASCDPKTTFLELLDARAVSPRLAGRIAAYRAAGTTAKVNLALSAPLRFAGRPHRTVERAFVTGSLDALERAFDAVKYGEFSVAPALDVLVATGAHPARAPAGHHVVSVVAHFAPFERRGGWTDDAREQLGDAVAAQLELVAPGTAVTTVAREVLTPSDIARRYGTAGGHVHHGDHALDQLFVRPVPECARYGTPIPGLYLCGSGSHPGGGLTGAPGMLAAAAIRAGRDARAGSGS